MRINCLGCGHMIFLGDAYDDYHGQIKCNICRSLMEIESEDGKLKYGRVVTQAPQKIEG